MEVAPAGDSLERVAIEATSEIPVLPPLLAETIADVLAMADPTNAHSPMSPDDQVSDRHVGLPLESHSTNGTTPMS